MLKMKMKTIFKFMKTMYYRDMTYNTKQKSLILDLIAAKRSDFSVKEIYAELIARGEQIGQTTVYRVIEALVEDGKLKQSLGADGATRYQYLEDCNHSGHCYLKCRECGRIEHIDCEDISELEQHIVKKHQFEMDKDFVINGKCEACV
jgi:Fur family ferric uptake transcriptional regulator